MDSPAINQIFRQLFAPARGCLRRHAQAAQNGFQQNLSHTRRGYATRRRTDYMGDGQSNWQQRLDHFPRDVSKQIREYPRLTAKELARRSQRPTRVKMFTRDFIDDSLYNPNYGYFPRNATIFNLAEPFDFNSIEDGAKFQKLVDQSYIEFEDDLDAIQQDDLRQLWHTPTELFRPYYGEAVARWLVANYKASLYPYHDLVIYEIGAGNGTLMCNILDHIRETDMDVYHRTKFRIIEISQSLAEMQNTSLRHSRYFTDHLEHIQIINKSIFDWDTHVPEPSFFLALEVIDNFAHDTLRYDPYTEQPLQGSVLIDEEGRFYEYYEPNLDDLVSRFLRLRRAASRHQPPRTPISRPFYPPWLRKVRHSLPFAPNLTVPEYLPTRLLQFFDILTTHFPHHRLLISDFTKLATPIPGLNAPIAQTRYKRENVMVTTPYIHQGYFDIFFPTDFELMEDIYRAVTGKLTRVCSHADFLGSWADIESTRLKSGENVLLGGDMGGWYANVGVMITA
ncbi:hypothetical protein LTR05_005321 [Lithohypha guttulata]|uniref:Protein arginine methyltransferase NDUFAF7 n=1 Tax=Lithohypha guttulata TaxID=1690604 RepID=A0AAN7SXK3_9EURO|nr:hypothetical protein LTR05_005321 [Lithohypha guttulata]